MPVAVWTAVVALQRLGLPDLDADPRVWRAAEAAGGSAGSAQRSGSTFYGRPGLAGFALERRLDATGTPLAVLVPHASGTVTAWIDGRAVADARPASASEPLLLPLPDGAAARAVTLRLHIAGQASGWSFAAAPRVGARATLERAWRWRRAFKITALEMTLAGAGLLAACAFAVARRRPQDRIYVCFAGGLVCWSLYNLHFLLPAACTRTAPWQALIHAALGGFLHCMVLFIHRLLHLRRERLERALAGVTWISVLTLGLAALTLDPARLWPLINVGYRFVLIGLGAYLLTSLVVLAARRDDPASRWLSSSALLTFGLGLHDSGRHLGLIDTPDNLMQHGVPVMLLVFGWLAVERFVEALGRCETLNASLDRRVQDQVREMAAQYEVTRALERSMVLAAERERLVRDMHDGLGGQLVALLSLSRSGAADARVLEAGLADALLDLRLVIDSLDVAGEDLAVGLGMLRARLDPRLRAAGLALHWDLGALPGGLRLGPEAVLHVLRILQEAVQNALKHARASALWVEARHDVGRVRVSLRDNGCGLPAPLDEGRGLRHMRRRAERVGATLNLEPAGPGTRVTLLLPLPA
jgi:signal transduction histidine kinase